MAKTPKAQYQKLVIVGSINTQTKFLLEELDIPKALSHSPEAPEIWANAAREAAANLIALADKISPARNPENPERGLRFKEVMVGGVKAKIAEPSNHTGSAVAFTMGRLSGGLNEAQKLKAQHVELTREWLLQKCPEVIDCATEQEIHDLLHPSQPIAVNKWILDKLARATNLPQETIARYNRKFGPR